MNEEHPSYHDLPIEGSWVEYLRARLPYSFMEITPESPQPRVRQYRLSDPVLLTGITAPERHNFWVRGNVYYMAGKLLDYYSMPQVTKGLQTVGSLAVTYPCPVCQIRLAHRRVQLLQFHPDGKGPGVHTVQSPGPGTGDDEQRHNGN